jgi:hypothetical protein
MKFPLPGPLCEAHSPLAVSKPMLYQVDGVQNVTAPAFVSVVPGAVARLSISDGVARRHRPSEIMRNAP